MQDQRTLEEKVKHLLALADQLGEVKSQADEIASLKERVEKLEDEVESIEASRAPKKSKR